MAAQRGGGGGRVAGLAEGGQPGRAAAARGGGGGRGGRPGEVLAGDGVDGAREEAAVVVRKQGEEQGLAVALVDLETDVEKRVIVVLMRSTTIFLRTARGGGD